MHNEVTTLTKLEKAELVQRAKGLSREEAKVFIQGFTPEVVLGEVNRLVYLSKFAMEDVIQASDNYKNLMHYEV